MLEQELQWERNLFFFLNGKGNAFWDSFFWGYSDKWIWVPFYLCLLGVFVYKKDRKEILILLLSVTLVVLLCDQISSGFCKPFFHRFRPSHHPDFQEQVKVIFGYRGGRYGFISGHAANAFGIAVFSALLIKNKFFTGTILLFAFLNAYSRVYMGVHFLSDIAAGALTGVLIGWLVYRIYCFSRKKLLKTDAAELKKSPYPLKSVYFLCIDYFIVILFLILFALRFKTCV